MSIEDLYAKFLESSGISTDTRKINKGSIFFALKGPNFNANTLGASALELGATYAVIDEVSFKKNEKYIVVENVLATLQQLARYHRKKLGIPIIAITGSNGKTTTKELVNAVLKTKYKTFATLGNLNNHIGVPLTLLAMYTTTEIGIVEMGANHQLEIDGYCQIAEPTHGLITNIGKAHLEGFGGVEGVKKGKGELYKYLEANNGTVFYNSEDPIISTILPKKNTVSYPNFGDYLSCKLLEEVPFVKFQTTEANNCTTHLSGKYNFENIAAALCIGKYFNIPSNAANTAVCDYDPVNNRSQILKTTTNTLYLDAYNANPSSMKVALENFERLNAENKVVILGDMFELGDESKQEHIALGKLLGELNFNKILLCGKEIAAAKEFIKTANHFSDRNSLESWLSQNKLENNTIFIKGSRGMGLENLIKLL